jgi:hypothetical protein
VTMLWRAFDKTVSRKPLAFAVDAVYGNSIDLGVGSHCKEGTCGKSLIIDARQCTAPSVHPGDPYAAALLLSSADTLALYMRQRPPRKRLRCVLGMFSN